MASKEAREKAIAAAAALVRRGEVGTFIGLPKPSSAHINVYQEKGPEVEAVQFDGAPESAQRIKSWIEQGNSGRKVDMMVQDTMILQIASTLEGVELVVKDDWIVRQDGHLAIYDDEQFKRKFSLLGRPASEELS